MEVKTELERLKDFCLTMSDGFEKNAVLDAIRGIEAHYKTKETDAVVQVIRESGISCNNHKEVLVIALHCLLLEKDFQHVIGDKKKITHPSSSLIAVEGWNHNSDEGVFCFFYKHLSQPETEFVMKCLVVGEECQVFISSSSNDEVLSLTLRVDEYVNLSSTPPTHDSLQNLAKLRAIFHSKIASRILPTATRPSSTTRDAPPPRTDCPPDLAFPRGTHMGGVGEGDVSPFPSEFPGPHPRFPLPGMEVGPNHPIFGGRGSSGSQTQGPVPGARFDPFGPVVGPGFLPRPFPPPPFPPRRSGFGE